MKTTIPIDTFKLKQSVNHTRINPPTQDLINDFVTTLKKNHFKGGIISSSGACSAWAADNSIYWIAPQLILQPRNAKQIETILKLARQKPYTDLCFTTRGGSTSTNAQSLNYSVMIDTVKYINQIIEHNLDTHNEDDKYIEVESGITAYELNHFLKPFGYTFPIQISTSNRATIGGMIATNAAGRGSLVYGNTGDHLLLVSGYLANGEDFQFEKISFEAANDKLQRKEKNWLIYQNLLLNHQFIINTVEKNYPKFARSHSAYNLPKIFDKDGINLPQLIAGSEGTLAVVVRARLKLTRINTFKKLIVVKYQSFKDALNHAKDLAIHQPHSIETMDETITHASRKLDLYSELENFLTINGNTCITNFIGLEQNNAEKINAQSKEITADLNKKHLFYEVIDESQIISKLYKLREQSAAFFSSPIKINSQKKTPAPFIEDSIVQVENLVDFIDDFYELLRSHTLSYGIFGHVDVGVLHLRPALNLRTNKDRQLIRKLTQGLVKILKKHNGLLWGEHGKGVRGEFTEELLGSDALAIINQIKRLFDPEEKLNPHKVARVKKDSYLIDSLPFKTSLLNIASPNNGIWDNALDCNGNGLCNSMDRSQAMCPSFKASRDIRYSPKGRVNMLRSYLVSKEIYSSKRNAKYGQAFETDLKHSLDYCLNCKACQSQCPLFVDIAKMSEEFNHYYYQNHKRPLLDSLLKRMENKGVFVINHAKLMNSLLHNPLSSSVLKKIGLIDIPKIEIKNELDEIRSHLLPTKEIIKKVVNHEKENSDKLQNTIALIFDGLTSPYDWQNFLLAKQVLEACEYQVFLVSDITSNKMLKLRGMFKEFNKQAKTTAENLNLLHNHKIKVVGVDSAIVHCFNSEYQDLIKARVLPVSEAIEKKIDILKSKIHTKKQLSKKYKLMSHCIEQTHMKEVARHWNRIFTNLHLDVEIENKGCCGMAGLFGHQTEKKEFSKKVYQTNWHQEIHHSKVDILASGFSCRSQVKRFGNKTIIHPLNLIANNLNFQMMKSE